MCTMGESIELLIRRLALLDIEWLCLQVFHGHGKVRGDWVGS